MGISMIDRIWVYCFIFWSQKKCQTILILLELEQLERLHSFWDTPRRPMITHTNDSHQIPSQNKTVKVSNFKKLPKIQI